jgi:hypothetical protein
MLPCLKASGLDLEKMLEKFTIVYLPSDWKSEHVRFSVWHQLLSPALSVATNFQAPVGVT